MRYFITLSFLLASIPSISQNTFPASGNVGIGTSSPSGLLHLKTPATGNFWSSYNYGANLIVDGPHHNAIALLDAGSSNPFAIANVSGKLTISKMPSLGDVSTAPTELLTVSNNGNVGIGTTTPNCKLDIAGNTGSLTGADLNITRSNSGGGVGNGSTIQFSDAQTGSYNIVQGSVNGLQFFNYYGGGPWSERMRIAPSGNVGIGTTAPNAGLEIFKGSSNDLALQVNSSGPGWGSGVRFKNSSTSGKTWGIYTGSDGIWHFSNVDASNDAIIVKTNNYVGIGTSIPDAPLTVKGQVHAQEVKVDLSVPGPDYVFDKEYKLASLDEIKTYIDQNKHLPEIPSAKEMEKNGVQLGEMNMLLLKKVEELTLYVIEQNKRDQDQKRQIENLLIEVEKLKSKK